MTLTPRHDADAWLRDTLRHRRYRRIRRQVGEVALWSLGLFGLVYVAIMLALWWAGLPEIR